MKTLYKSVLFVGLGFAALSANAQSGAAKDTTLNRQVILQRDYNPTIQEASKINTTPAIYEPQVTLRNANYQLGAPRITVLNNRLGTSLSGDIKNEVEYDKKIGYFQIGIGSHSNLDVAAGVRALNTATDRLNIHATHNSTSGDVDYIESGYLEDEAKAKYSHTKINLDYQHTFEPSILMFDASYMNTGYNYYGNPFLPNTVAANPFFDKKQNMDVIRFGVGLQSNENNEPYVKYKGAIGYSNFKNKYGPVTTYKGLNGGQFNADVDLSAPFDGDKMIGLKGHALHQSVGSVTSQQAMDTKADHSLTNVYFAPYIAFEGTTWNASLGVKAGTALDAKKSVSFAPDIYASVRVLDKNSLYASITGGINENTILQVLEENRYVNPATRVGFSKTLYDLKAGFKVGSVSGFEFEAFAGYKSTKKDHLYVMANNGYNNITPLPALYAYSWGNVSNAAYADISTGHIGAMVKTYLIPYTNLSARVTGYTYNVKYTSGYVPGLEVEPLDKKAWGRPTVTAEFNADVVDIVPNLTLTLNYLFAGGRKAYFNNTSVSMKAINELNFRGDYKITDWMSANVRLNNVLFQKYEFQYGYAMQGFNVLGGMSFVF